MISCTREIKTGIDPSAVPPDGVTYDETNSSSTALGFYWEVDNAIAAGAVSFTAQIVKDPEIGANVYSGAASQTLQAKSGTNDGIIFNGLTVNSKYYARVRANYPRSVYSDWVYVTDASGKKAVIKLGKGIVNENIEAVTGASARLLDVSPTTAVVEWTVTDFSDAAIDKAALSSIELYRDEQCMDLLVSWDFPDGSIFSKAPRFIFSGLSPGTPYWFIAECSTTTEQGEDVTFRSEPLRLETEPAKAIYKKSGYAQPGEVILFQDFSELIWGGDAVNQAVGYSAEQRGSATALTPARGWNPIGGSLGYYLCTPSTEIGLYNTLRKALIGSGASLADWAEWREDPTTVGMVCARPGSVKVGASSKVGAVVTPPLSALSSIATVEVRFKASPFGSSSSTLDPLGTCIRIIDGASISDNIIRSASSDIVVQTFDLKNDLAMSEYAFTIHNVSPGVRLAIGGYRSQNESGQHRLVVDDISIKVLEYGSTAVDVPTPSIQLTVGEGQIRADWSECENATSYDVEYKMSDEEDWHSAGNTTYTTFTIRGLQQLTSYDVRVKARNSDLFASEWSEVKTVTTPAVTKSVHISAPFVDATQIGFRWYTDSNWSMDILTGYRLELYKGSSLVVRLSLTAYGEPDLNEMTVSATDNILSLWNASTGPSFVFTGLEPSTAYTLNVTNKDLQISGTMDVTTAASGVVTLPSGTVSTAGTILFEDFSELLWGGLPVLSEYGGGFPGFSSVNRGSLPSFTPLSGEQPLAGSSEKLYLCQTATQYGLLNTTWRAIGQSRLKDWGAISESYEGSAAGSLCGMAGIIKLGAAGSWCQILTPALNCLPSNSTIKVSFRMGAYTEDGVKVLDPGEAVIKVIDNVTLGSQGSMHQAYQSGTVAYEKTFSIPSRIGMQNFEFTLNNVKPGARIAIGTTRSSSEGSQRRAFLDDVKIELVR